MEKYVIGIDGGGTGSKGITADMTGKALKYFKGGATNYNGGQKEEIDDNIHRLLKAAAEGRKTKDCQAVCIGSAGVSNHSAEVFLREAVLREGFDCPIRITADSVTAHAGALHNHAGIILIAGTGTICFGKKENGDVMRTGGYGHLIDDEGSAYDIARRMLRAVVRAADGRGEETRLGNLIFRQLQVDSLEEMVSWLYRKERTKKEIAALAVLIEEAAGQGDMAAGKILEDTAEALAEVSVPVVDFFEGKARLAVSGSVLKNNKAVRDIYFKKMQMRYPLSFGEKEGLLIRDAEHEADFGAVLLALDCIK